MGISEKVRILLVDDDPAQLKIASYMLRKKESYDCHHSGRRLECLHSG